MIKALYTIGWWLIIAFAVWGLIDLMNRVDRFFSGLFVRKPKKENVNLDSWSRYLGGR